MAFTKITAAGIGSTETVTLDGVSVINNESIGGNLTVTGNATIGGVLTYEDVTNVDSVGLITARNGIVVGSGITLSKDGDIFATGVTTSTTFSGSGANLTNLPAANLTGTLPAIDGSALTGIDVGLSTASAQVSGITTVIDLSKDDIRLDVTGNVTIDTKGGSEGTSHSLRIVNSGISTVSFSSYFKFPSGSAPILPTASGAISMISFSIHKTGAVGVATVLLAGSSVNFS